MKTVLSRILLGFISLTLIFLLGFPLISFTGEKQGKVILNDKVTFPFKINSNTKVLLLYFGYVGCRTICVPSLEEIAQIANHFANSRTVAFYFINISKNGKEANDFAKYFHKNITGLDLPSKDVSKLMSSLRAYSSASLSGDNEISHTGYLYLIKQNEIKNFTLKYMYYTRPFDKNSIIIDIKKELKWIYQHYLEDMKNYLFF